MLVTGLDPLSYPVILLKGKLCKMVIFYYELNARVLTAFRAGRVTVKIAAKIIQIGFILRDRDLCESKSFFVRRYFYL